MMQGLGGVLVQLEDPLAIEGTLAELDVAKLLRMHDVAFRFVVPQAASQQDYGVEILIPNGRRAFVHTNVRLSLRLSARAQLGHLSIRPRPATT
jgi:hypothetical protein